jgi:hypothetical protein
VTAVQILTVNVGSSSVKLDRFDGAGEIPRHLGTMRLPPDAPLPDTLGTPWCTGWCTAAGLPDPRASTRASNNTSRRAHRWRRYTTRRRSP